MPRLPRAFFRRPALEVAPDLLGKVLVHAVQGEEAAGRIVECEAYAGPEDKAAHSFGGRRTARTEPMFLDGGHAYVYFLYGMHWAFNVVCAAPGQPEAVLVRALEPVRGLHLMGHRRDMGPDRKELANGPGKLCQAMGITKAQNGADLCAPGAAIYLEEGPAPKAIGRGPRINVAYAGDHAQRPWRFWERGNPHVSVRPRD